MPLLTDREFWNAQHDYRRNWSLLAIQIVAVCLVTVVALFILTRRPIDSVASGPIWSLAGAFLGGAGALAIGMIGVTAIMAPLLEAAPQARVLATSLLFAGYLAAIVAGTLTGARIRMASSIRALAGLAAGQLVVVYTAFALLPDDSPSSHRLLLLVWLIAAALGATAGVIWARLDGIRLRELQDLN